MERIILEVDSATAEAWRRISPEVRRTMEKMFRIKMGILSEKDREESFEKLLEEARNEAMKNGLTEELLEKLLNED